MPDNVGTSRFDSGFDRKAHEAYFTEPWVTRCLLDAVHLPMSVWESACGPGYMAKEITASGRSVFASDLVDYGYGATGPRWDFLTCDYVPHGALAIVTNPPYGKNGKLAERFIEHALALMMPRGGVVAMLLRFEFDAGYGPARMRTLWDNPHWSRKLVLPRRPRWDDWWEGHPPTDAPRHPFAWFVWDARHVGPPITMMLRERKANDDD